MTSGSTASSVIVDWLELKIISSLLEGFKVLCWWDSMSTVCNERFRTISRSRVKIDRSSAYPHEKVL